MIDLSKPIEIYSDSMWAEIKSIMVEDILFENDNIILCNVNLYDDDRREELMIFKDDYCLVGSRLGVFDGMYARNK